MTLLYANVQTFCGPQKGVMEDHRIIMFCKATVGKHRIEEFLFQQRQGFPTVQTITALEAS